MKIIQANSDHIIEVLFLLRQCMSDHEKQNVLQWSKNQSSAITIQSDINNKALYIVKNNNVTIGTISLCEEHEKSDSKSKKCLSVKRFAVIPFWQKKGVGKLLMDFSEKHALEKGCSTIKVNVSINNARALEFYNTRNYKKSKEFTSEETDQDYITFEKQIIGELVS